MFPVLFDTLENESQPVKELNLDGQQRAETKQSQVTFASLSRKKRKGGEGGESNKEPSASEVHKERISSCGVGEGLLAGSKVQPRSQVLLSL